MDDFATFVNAIQRRQGERTDTGIRDLTGAPILTGDIVEFWFCADAGFSSTRRDDMTRMADVIEAHDGGFFAIDFDTCGGLSLWKLDGSCRIVGNVFETPELLRDALLRFKP